MTNYSFIRWVGGKSWIAPTVQQLIDGLNYNNYFEPFMGGASVFFFIEPKNKSFLSDLNPELVETFCTVRDHPEDVIQAISALKSDEETYYRVRESDPQNAADAAARFLFLNLLSYNGLYRVNHQGKYNASYGKLPRVFDSKRLLRASEKLQGATVACQDFAEWLPCIEERDLVFIDPPYLSTDHESFLRYNANKFSIEDHKRLVDFVDGVIRKRAYYILTTGADKAVYEEFQSRGRLIELLRRCRLSCKADTRRPVTEFIFTNIPARSSTDITSDIPANIGANIATDIATDIPISSD